MIENISFIKQNLKYLPYQNSLKLTLLEILNICRGVKKFKGIYISIRQLSNCRKVSLNTICLHLKKLTQLELINKVSKGVPNYSVSKYDIYIEKIYSELKNLNTENLELLDYSIGKNGTAIYNFLLKNSNKLFNIKQLVVELSISKVTIKKWLDKLLEMGVCTSKSIKEKYKPNTYYYLSK